MARTNALNMTATQLAELQGQVIEAIQKGAVSERLKNRDFSGDPTTGSVEFNRFKNAALAAYGTARAAGEGTALNNSGKVTVNIDQDFEIVEEVEMKDIKLVGIEGLMRRRARNHSQRLIAALDRAFFAEAVSAGTAVTTTLTALPEVIEAVIQSVETTENDWVDGVDREMIAITLSPAAYGRLRNFIDTVSVPTVNSGEESVGMFHGVRVYSNTRQTVDVIAQVDGSIAQPVLVDQYDSEKIPLSKAYGIELFPNYGTKAITPDLIKYMTALPA